MIPLIINSFRNDLESRVETHVCLALAAVCNIGGKGMAESLAPSVEKLIMSACVVLSLIHSLEKNKFNHTSPSAYCACPCLVFLAFKCSTTGPMIKKKAAMCLMRLYKRYPDIITPEVRHYAAAAPRPPPPAPICTPIILMLSCMSLSF
jgi:AP-2 complex subunit alpha